MMPAYSNVSASAVELLFPGGCRLRLHRGRAVSSADASNNGWLAAEKEEEGALSDE
jgi:hypothetical protein